MRDGVLAVMPDPEIVRQLARGSNGEGPGARALAGCHEFSEIVPVPGIAQPEIFGGELPIFWIKGEAWTA